MPNRLQIRRKTSTGAPASGDLLQYELCWVDPDRQLYIEKTDASVFLINHPGNISDGRYFYTETDFLNGSTPQAQFVGAAIGSGTNTTVPTGTAIDVNHPGVILIRSSTAANSGYFYLGGTSTNSALMVINGGEVFNFVFRTMAGFTNTTLRFGFPNTLSVTAPNDGVWLEFLGNSTLQGRTGNAGSLSTTASNFSLSTSTWYHGRVSINEAKTQALFQLYSEAGSLLWTDTLSNNIPGATRTTRPGFIVTNSGTTATDLLCVDYMNAYTTKRLQRGNF